MHRVTLLNPKGGSGKTTLATSLASYYAVSGYQTALVDYDAQGSSTRWLGIRPERCPPIHGIAAYRNPAGVTRSWHLRTPPGTERVVTDTPAGIRTPELGNLIRATDVILIPVLPSSIDIDAVTDFIAKLRQIREVRAGERRVALVANRVRGHPGAFQRLQGTMEGAGLDIIAWLRDTQSYLRAGAEGVGVHELTGARALRDQAQWAPLLAWIERRSPREFLPAGDAPGSRAAAVPT